MVVEPLESRCLLSVMPAPAPTVNDGVLSVTGTVGNDNIRIRIVVHRVADLVDLFELAVKVNGTTTNFNETSIQTIQKIQIDGLDGDDKIDVRRANQKSQIDGGAGNDTIFGGANNDLIDGGAGNDSIRGNGGDDVLVGGDGNDRIFGGAGKDSLVGGNGADKLRGGAGRDLLDGARGKNRLRGGRGIDPARPDALDEGASDADAGDGGENEPIWWDPEANTDDSGNPIDIANV